MGTLMRSRSLLGHREDAQCSGCASEVAAVFCSAGSDHLTLINHQIWGPGACSTAPGEGDMVSCAPDPSWDTEKMLNALVLGVMLSLS